MATISLVLTACGSASPAPENDAQERAGAGSGAGEPADPARCAVDDPQALRGPVLAEVDVDGDGRDDAVRQTSRAQACPGALVVVTGDRLLTAGALDGPPATEAFVAELGNGTRLLVTRQDHPRGGVQSRFFAESEGRLVEVTDDEGNALVPFAATDTSPGSLVSVSCAEDGVTVTESRVDPGRPTDREIVQTSYRVEDGRAVAGDAPPTRETVAADRLRRGYPGLADNAVLEDCRTD